MAIARPSTRLLFEEQKEERKQVKQRLVAVDQALDELRQAKERLEAATNLYLERLKGTPRGKRQP